MCFVKDLFWDEEERVMQLHPPMSEYVKNDRYCLHLWKPKHAAIPAPPPTLVGIVGMGPEETYLRVQAFLADLTHRLEAGRSL
ncbi:hypothetical protein CK489_27710 [Bradyrhizobium sp. UFLA03-84]|nr:hypothetical protein CK489_27710 [Bradyrhizobium sp. UFLA03-84]